jgi:hypothetical protein
MAPSFLKLLLRAIDNLRCDYITPDFRHWFVLAPGTASSAA